MKFLINLSEVNKPLAIQDFNRLQNLKRTHIGDENARLEPWDRYFYSQFVSPNLAESETADPFHSSPQHEPNDELSRYFSIGRTFEGMSRLFSALYGITLVPAPIGHGETWHPDVRKLEVIDEKIGKIGVVYCDLFNREDASKKYENAVCET